MNIIYIILLFLTRNVIHRIYCLLMRDRPRIKLHGERCKSVRAVVDSLVNLLT